MTTKINSSTAGAGGLITTADNSGILELQTAGVTAITVDASQIITFANSLTSPVLVTPVLGTPSSGVLSNCTGLYILQLFKKANPFAVAFNKTAAFAVSTQTVIYVEVGGVCLTIPSTTVVSMPSPVTGTDYAIWVATDGTLSATDNHVTPPSTNARKIGGFHYAASGNAAAQAGSDTTPAINAYSLYDLNWRFNGIDNRGMTLVGGKFWADIYLLNTDYTTNGTSKYNVVVASGDHPPFISPFAGGNGSTRYGTLTWWEAAEVASWAGKRLPSYQEFQALAYGTTENSSIGSDPASTVLNAAYVSKWGCNQVSGCYWQWGAEFGGSYVATGWVDNNGARGQTYNLSNAVVFGGVWNVSSLSGSRCSAWNFLPSFSTNSVGARCVGDHMVLV